MDVRGENNAGAATQLDEELAFYGEQKDELLRHHCGKYVLIRGREIVGTFTKFEEAYEDGVKRFGTVPMLIKQVVSEEPVQKLPALTHGLVHNQPPAAFMDRTLTVKINLSSALPI